MSAQTRRAARSCYRAVAVLPLVAVTLAGCGSTSLRQNSPQAGGLDTQVGVGGLDGTSVDRSGQSLGGDSNYPGGSSIGGSTGSGGTLGSTGGATGTTGGTSFGGSGAGGGGGTGASGTNASSAKPIRMGFPSADVSAIFAAFGKSEDAPSDINAGTKAMVKYINDHGGVFGRKIVPYFHNVDATGDASTEAQKACQDFTQDNKVDIVVDGLGSAPLAQCLAKSNIADMGTTNWLPDAADLAAGPNWMIPTAMRVDRQMQGLLRAMASAGKLVKGDKVGVMVEDCPYGHRTYDNVIVPLLKQFGATATQSSVKCLTNLAQDVATITNDVQRAVLAFNSAGVTDVIALHNAEAFLVSNFTQNAKQQNYFPKYFVTSNAYPWQNSHSEATIKIDPSALPKMSGAGWLGLLDVGANFKPTAAQKAAQAVCTKIEPTQAGATSQDAYAKPFRQNIFFSGCHGLFTAVAVMNAAGGSLNYQALRSAYASLKQQHYVSAVLSEGSIGGSADTQDGPGTVRPFAWDAKRQTFDYTGAPVSVS